MLESNDARRIEEQIAPRRRLYVLALALLVVFEALSAIGVVPGAHAEVAAYVTGGAPLVAQSLFAAFLVFAFTRPSRGELTTAIASGAVLEGAHAWLGLRLASDRWMFVASVGGGFGISALAVCAASAVRARGDERRRAIERLTAVGVLPTFMLLSSQLLELTRAFHPQTLDFAACIADGALGFQPSFALARTAQALPTLGIALQAVYFALPSAAAVVWIAELRRPSPASRSRDLAVSLVVAGLVVGVLSHLLPVSGPRNVFASDFPGHPPNVAFLVAAPIIGAPGFRSGIPSLHAIWGLLLYWHARPYGRPLRMFAGVWLVATLVATLAGGDQYVVDLVISIPVAVAIQAALTTTIPLATRARWLALATTVALLAIWLVLLRSVPDFFRDARYAALALFAATVVVPLVAERDLERFVERQVEPPPAALVHREAMPRATFVILTMFFLSGFAGLVYEVMFAKSLALVFGSTATAATTVLATYMGGMSLGSWLGGRVAARTRAPLKLYAVCEAGVAVSCAFAPAVFGLLRASYAALARGSDPGSPSLVALQVALGATLLLPPTVLMGATLPLLARQLAGDRSGLGKVVGALYGVNTLGAAAGALATGYALLPLLGVLRTTLLAVVLNLVVVLVALRWAARGGPLRDQPDPEESAAAPDPSSTLSSSRVRGVGLVVLCVGGVVTLALEGVYTHLLAVVVGNSAFAFSAMLFCFLVGLGLGSTMGRAWLRAELSLAAGIGVAQALVAVAVLGGVFAWNDIPSYFAGFRDYGLMRTFGEHEVVRLAVCALTMIPPALFIGASYPLAIECVGRGSDNRVRALGRAAALNTLGNITGALLGGFVLLPRFGSLRAVQILGTVSLALALVPLVIAKGSDGQAARRMILGAAGLGFVLLLVQPASFDLGRLASGANVYFHDQGYANVIDHAESADGGLTTVTLDDDHRGRKVKTLLTNGKFQGDDSAGHELEIQVSFTLFPLLHTDERRNALVIGFGTGTSARVLADAGFENIDVADLSRDITELGERHFTAVNDRVLERPNVHLHVTDGRNYLLVEPRRYDLITMEITSIWFAGASSLYNEEFYRLAKARLTEHGVLQQWVQLHHIDAADIIAILASVRSVFERAWLYVTDNQGILVACDGDCAPREATLARIDEDPALGYSLGLLGGAKNLLRSRLLTPAGLDALLAQAGAPLGALASTDDNLFLEYSTPRGNVRGSNESFQENLRVLSAFTSRSPYDGTHLAH